MSYTFVLLSNFQGEKRPILGVGIHHQLTLVPLTVVKTTEKSCSFIC